jgi:polar amino acid transport system permease protein
MSFIEILALLSRGALQTVVVTGACAATGLGVGLGVAMLRRLGLPWLSGLLAVFVYVFRGVPVLVLLFLVFFGLPAIGYEVRALPSMMLSLGLVAGAYLAEVFRGALESVDPVEITAAEAMGLSRMQTLLSIEIPQMLRFSVPGMINEFTTVMKYSPFAYTVGIPEITKQAMALASTTLRGIEIYLAVGIFYFAIYRIMLSLIRLIEARYRVPGIGTT